MSQQPQGAASWKVAALVAVMALIAMCGLAFVVSQIGPAGSVLVIAVSTLPPLVLGSLIMLLDRYEPEPHHLLWLTFAAGATLAVAFSVLVGSPAIQVVSAAVGEAVGTLAGMVVFAPLVEEVAKGAILLAIYLRRKHEINGVVDGVVYGSMVGLGFAFAENIMYFAEGLAAGFSEFATVVVVRAVFSPFAHPLFTSMTGIGFAIAVKGGRNSAVWPFAGLAGAITLHAIWNGAAVTGGLIVVYLLFFIPLLIAVVTFAWMAARHEAKLFRTFLARDVRLGLLTAEEVEELASLSYRRTVVRYFKDEFGTAARSARIAFHHAAADLAFHRHRLHPAASEPAEEMRLVRDIARYKRSIDPSWVAPAGVGEL